MIAVRGAAIAAADTERAIGAAAVTLLDGICRANGLEKRDLISVFFSLTGDLTKIPPAESCRAAGYTTPAYFCLNEMKTDGGLKKCVRVLVHAQSQILQPFARHVYSGGAAALRTDINKTFSIAIDGPSAAGKTTAAKLLARRCNMLYADTGAIYRAAAYKAARAGINLKNEDEVSKNIGRLQVEIKYAEGVQRMFADGREVSDEIRGQDISMAASDISKVPAVREYATRLARALRGERGIVMEGRDICGYVLPDAEYKFFLTADPEVRARRRYKELADKGGAVSFETVARELAERDRQDETRKTAPLARTADAVLIDSSALNIEEVFGKFLEVIETAGGQ